VIPAHVPAILQEPVASVISKSSPSFKIFQRRCLLFLLFFRSCFFKQSTGLASTDFGLGGRSTFARSQQNRSFFLLNKLPGHTGGWARCRLWNSGALLLRCAFTEGIGVYMQKNAGPSFFDDLATGALIPLEMRHVWHRLIFHRPISLQYVLLANCFIVWFLYLVLRRDKLESTPAPKPELIETVRPSADIAARSSYLFGARPNSASAGIVFSIGSPITLV